MAVDPITSAQPTVCVLVVAASAEPALRLVRHLQDAFAVSWEHAVDSRALVVALEREHWDLALVHDDLPALSILCERRNHLPVIFLTPKARSDEFEAALEAGAADYIAETELSRLLPVVRRELRRLDQLEQLKSEFLSTVSHQLRTPLSNIKLYIDLLERGKPAKIPQYVQTLRYEVDGLLGLVENLLLISRFDLGKVRPELRPVDVCDLVQELMDGWSGEASERAINLRGPAFVEVPQVLADPQVLRQALGHILANAFDYTPSGGQVALSVTAKAVGAATWVSVAVADTGVGIAPCEQPHVFERFYRGSAARQSQRSGAGLGLSIARDLVRQQGGKITLASLPGRGSTFTVWLPAVD